MLTYKRLEIQDISGLQLPDDFLRSGVAESIRHVHQINRPTDSLVCFYSFLHVMYVLCAFRAYYIIIIISHRIGLRHTFI